MFFQPWSPSRVLLQPRIGDGVGHSLCLQQEQATVQRGLARYIPIRHSKLLAEHQSVFHDPLRYRFAVLLLRDHRGAYRG